MNSSLNTEINSLDSILSGESYQAFYSEYDEIIKNINSFSNDLKNMSSSLYSLAARVEEALEDDDD